MLYDNSVFKSRGIERGRTLSFASDSTRLYAIANHLQVCSPTTQAPLLERDRSITDARIQN